MRKLVAFCKHCTEITFDNEECCSERNVILMEPEAIEEAFMLFKKKSSEIDWVRVASAIGLYLEVQSSMRKVKETCDE